MMGGWYGGGGAGSWIAMVVLMGLFWAGVVTVVVVLLRHSSRNTDHPPKDEAERILHARFARGEIDEQEYTARRAVLREAG
ncbi:MAG: SHOCT domain-containing protein [Mycobacteriaceae bacterium]